MKQHKQSSKAPLSWTPTLRSVGGVEIYCSEACGGNCTKAAHDAAERNAIELCVLLDKLCVIEPLTELQIGPGWKIRVWESLGWRYIAISRCGRWRVELNAAGEYTVSLGPADWAGCRWFAFGKKLTPLFIDVHAQAIKDRDEIAALLKPFWE